MQQLSEDIQAIIEKTGGTWGIVLEDLETQEKWQWNENAAFNAASLIKIPIMVAAFDQFNDEKIRLSESIKLKEDDKVGGSGVLQHLSSDLSLSIYDLIVLMIIQSDNTATNILIDYLGKRHIGQTMSNIGLKQTQLHNKLMTVPVQREGPNVTTAKEMGSLLKQIVKGQIISAYACEQMIRVMKKQQIQDSLPGRLPDPDYPLIGAQPKWELAHKTGMVTDVRHDVGIFYVKHRTLVAAVLSQGISSNESMLTFQELGLKIKDHLQK